MSVRLMSEVWELDLPSAQKFVLLALADYANDEGRNAYPSVARIGAKCSLSERSVQYALSALREAGLLVIECAASQHQPTAYRVVPGVQNLRGAESAGRKIRHPGVQNTTPRGATVAPNPKRSIKNHHTGGSVDEEFAQRVRPIYPARHGDMRWQEALSHYRAARKAGESCEAIVAGIERYAAYCQANGIIGTRHVKQAASFLGREKCWLEPWESRAAPAVADAYRGTKEWLTCARCQQEYARIIGRPDLHACQAVALA